MAQGLTDRINQAAKITIRDQEAQVELAKKNGTWVVASRYDYLADISAIRSLLLRFSQAQIIEQKTKNPELYSRLGVQDLSAEEARGQQLTVHAEDDSVLLDIIVGDYSQVSGGAYYARLATEEQSFLTTGDLEIDSEVANWFDSGLTAIAADRISEMKIRHNTRRPIKIHKEDSTSSDFSLEKLPRGKKLSSQYSLNQVPVVLSDLKALDILPKQEHTFSKNAIRTQFKTFDGILVEFIAEQIEQAEDGEAYVAIEVVGIDDILKEVEDKLSKQKLALPSLAADPVAEPAEDQAEEEPEFDPIQIRAEIGQYKQKFSDWVYKISATQFDKLNLSLDTIVEDDE